jgi:hypothetical protein
MDVSGSMDEEKKNIAKRFFMLLYLFLTRNYEHIEVVFIRHHTVAKEVDEDDFFHSRESGGTVVSSALELMKRNHPFERYANAPGTSTAPRLPTATTGTTIRPIAAKCSPETILPLRAVLRLHRDHPTASRRTCGTNTKNCSALAHPGHFAMQHIGKSAGHLPGVPRTFQKEAGMNTPAPLDAEDPSARSRFPACRLEWSFDALIAAYDVAIGRVAREYKLDTYPHQLE